MTSTSQSSPRRPKFLREPLLHFSLLAALLFTAYTWLHSGGGNDPQVVHITASEIAWLRHTWTLQWQRSPDEEEMRGLVMNYLKEALLARAARELGLGDNDTIVRRRLAQKMEFLLQDTADLVEPGQSELLEFYRAHPSLYRTPARISFTQVYFRTETAARHHLATVGDLAADGSGDPSLLDRGFSAVDHDELARQFGPAFADAVFALDTGPWQGPVASGYGFHLVRIGERLPAQQRPFEAVRRQVADDWRSAQQRKASEQLFAGLLKKYRVVIDDDETQTLIGPLAAAAP